MSIINTIETLSNPITQQAYVDLTGQILREQQLAANNQSNIAYSWLGNAMQSVSRLFLADAIRLSGAGSLETINIYANSFLMHQGSAYYDSGQAEIFNVMPSNVGTNVFVTPSYRVLVSEKDFRYANTVENSNITAFTFVEDYVSNIISSSNIYSALSITTGLDFALANNYLSSFNVDANSFVSENSIDAVADAIELSFAIAKNSSLLITGGGI